MVFVFKQKTAYEMRISDWSSDVCSSDLCLPPRHAVAHQRDRAGVHRIGQAPRGSISGDVGHARSIQAVETERHVEAVTRPSDHRRRQIGRATCRERECQYVKISGVAVTLKKPMNANKRKRKRKEK